MTTVSAKLFTFLTVSFKMFKKNNKTPYVNWLRPLVALLSSPDQNPFTAFAVNCHPQNISDK